MKLFTIKKESQIVWSDIICLGYGFTTQFPENSRQAWLCFFGIKIKLLKELRWKNKQLTDKIAKEFYQCKSKWLE